MRLNQEAFDHAKSLIKKGKVVEDSDWSEAQASTDEENEFLDDHDWQTYGKWFLAIDTDANEETKDRYNFPYGDFNKVHRDGLIAAKQRAAQYDYQDIEEAADKLLQQIDGEDE